MAESDELKGQWTGHDLFDLEGDRIGTVEDVVYGGATGDPGWLVVGTDTPGADKILVPVADVRRAGDRLSVPHTKETGRGRAAGRGRSGLDRRRQGQTLQVLRSAVRRVGGRTGRRLRGHA